MNPSDFNIEEGVPIPEVDHSRNRKYPWDELLVGDSFFAHGQKPNTLRSSAKLAKKRTGFKFVSRAVNGGARGWRIE